MKFIFGLVLAFSFTHAFAGMCDGESVVPSYSCSNPHGGADVRLYIMEYQSCEEGKIVKFDRSLTGLVVDENNNIRDIQEGNISVTYEAKRTLINPDFRVDSLSFILPTSAVLSDGKNKIEMKMTRTIEPNYEGAPGGENHYVGSFTITKANGQKKSGKLNCSVSN